MSLKTAFFPTDSPRFYPDLNINKPTTPIRIYATPLLGFLIKVVMLIPVWVILFGLGIAVAILGFINSFVVIFTGNYSQTVYMYVLGLMRLTTKAIAFLFGFTDYYPGLNINNNEDVTVEMAIPINPNRLWAIPFLGGITRIIVLIPFAFFEQIASRASFAGVFFSSLPVLFKGSYPENTYELGRDSIRLSQASTAFMFGLTDQYPSFWISLNHKKIKILLLIAGLIFTVGNYVIERTSNHTSRTSSFYSQSK